MRYCVLKIEPYNFRSILDFLNKNKGAKLCALKNTRYEEMLWASRTSKQK